MFHFQVLTTGTDALSYADAQALIKVLGRQHRWLAGGIGSENRTFQEVASMVVT